MSDTTSCCRDNFRASRTDQFSCRFSDENRKIRPCSAGVLHFQGRGKCKLANCSWNNEEKKREDVKYENDVVRDLLSAHPEEFATDETMFDKLVRMQHFGLPTRLLDVTSNPLVALFNASKEFKDQSGTKQDGKVYYISVPYCSRKYFDSDTVRCISHIANLTSLEKNDLLERVKSSPSQFNEMFAEARESVDTHQKSVEYEKPTCRLLHFIRTERPSFQARITPSELHRSWYVVPRLSNRRIIQQAGAFIIYGLWPPLRKPKPRNRQINIHYYFLVPAESKSTIIKELATLGIVESSLIPGIERTANYIAERYRNGVS